MNILTQNNANSFSLNRILPNTMAFIHVSTEKAALNQLSTFENITYNLYNMHINDLKFSSYLRFL